ncbi:tetratricopeptide repeat protein [Methylobacter psychrophilus]|uniref:tetratricopeptide repeat protein n=1 Tax=Methylobacter psychrophilus TaxID=96941 RepID=UPI0021D4DE6A|nr:tetratricopeptide repeat protein [Methylobacter psychrophilus]
MFKFPLINPTLLFLVFFFTVPVFAEEDATMHQVYLAAQAGKFNEAQSMMDKVLSDHPNSAKAHFVEAELLAKQGLFSKANAELNTAERLQPGLPFAKPEVLQNLKARIASSLNGAVQSNNLKQGMPSILKDWLPMMLLVLGVGLVILLIWFMSRRNTGRAATNNYASNVPGSNMSTAGTGGVSSLTGQPAPGGVGSGLMGSLATGAAMGAGVVAGEALMHHFIDGDKNNVTSEPPVHNPSPWDTSSNSNPNDNDDMGGSDFGIADASSWEDDQSGDGGDDWT